MRKLAIAVALASTALATPAVARDRSVYVGLEGGVMWVENARINTVDANGGVVNFRLHHNSGYDVDAIAGYDFGGLRAEVEVADKRAGLDTLNLTTDLDGHVTTTSLMGNLLLDFGNENGF